jgi:hypothetical protein
MILVRKSEGKRPMGRPRCRWVDNIRMDLWGEGLYRVLVGKLEGKGPLGRPRHRWVDNIRMYLWDVGIWTGLGWLRIETGGGRL